MKDVRDIGNNRVISQLVDNQSVTKMWIKCEKNFIKYLDISTFLRIFTYIKQLKGMSYPLNSQIKW